MSESHYIDIWYKYIKTLVDEEKQIAIKKFGLYKNNQEFWGAISEEVDEVNENINNLHHHVKKLWSNIKIDMPLDNELSSIQINALEAIKELIQVLSDIDKYFESTNNDNK